MGFARMHEQYRDFYLVYSLKWRTCAIGTKG